MLMHDNGHIDDVSEEKTVSQARDSRCLDDNRRSNIAMIMFSLILLRESKFHF